MPTRLCLKSSELRLSTEVLGARVCDRLFVSRRGEAPETALRSSAWNVGDVENSGAEPLNVEDGGGALTLERGIHRREGARSSLRSNDGAWVNELLRRHGRRDGDGHPKAEQHQR